MNAKKRIAIFGIKYYPALGGSSRVAESIIRDLHHKYDFTIYCYKTDKPKVALDGVKVIAFPKLPFGAIGVFFYYTICFIHLYFSKPFDLIHVHKTDSSLFIPWLKKKSPVIATSQEAPYVRDKWNSIGKAYFRWMERIFVGSKAVLTSVSKPLADYYFKEYGRQVHYVPNGVEISYERNPSAAEAILQKYRVSGDYIFFAARRIMSTKGGHTLLAALKKLNYSGPIVIAGEESHAKSYMNKIRQLAKGLDVKFIGFVSDKPTLMSLIEKAKYFAFPSETEGLSLMLLEAGSLAKTPIIASDIPENTQVFDDEEVLFFKDKDADDLSEKIAWAESNPAEMEMKVARAANRVKTEYSSAVITNKYENLYLQILAGGQFPNLMHISSNGRALHDVHQK